MAFTDILPDPTHPINAAGQADAGGVAGPGYSDVKLSSIEPVMKNSYNSQRKGKDLGYHHKWMIDIGYNALNCDDFHLIYSFVGYRQTILRPFYVSIPPYEAQLTTGITSDGASTKDDILTVSGTGVVQGSIFNIVGSSKIYMVTRVETSSVFEGTAPAAGKERLHITPALQEDVSAATGLNFNDPLFKVVQVGADSNYSLDKNGLFNYGLRLEEVVT